MALLALIASLFAASVAACPSGIPSPVLVGEVVAVNVAALSAVNVTDKFNATEVAAVATFTSPDASIVHSVEAFVFQNYSEAQEGNWGSLTPVGEPCFLARFAPNVTGRWTLQATVQGKQTVSGSFVVGANPDYQGMITVSRANPTLFAFRASQETYLPLGENNAWGAEADYHTWWGAIASHGGNYSRLWLGGYSAFVLQTDAAGVGKFDLEAAWRLDRTVFDIAPQYGMRLLLSLHTFSAFRTSQYFACWPQCNPYSEIVSSPDDFWGNELCREYTARFLRYVVARYGSSAHVMSWELFNEVDGVQDYNEQVVSDWHSFALQVLHSADGYDHLRTTSFAQSPGSTLIDSQPLMSYTQTHSYNSNDLGAVVAQWNSYKSSKYGKPTYVGEVGTSSQSPDIECYDDPHAVGLFNALAVPVFSGGAGGSMRWWWDSSCNQAPQDYAAFDVPHQAMHVAQRFMTTHSPWAYLPEATSNVSNSNLWAVSGGNSSALVMVRNTDYNWKSMLTSNFAVPSPIQGSVTIPGMLPGEYSVQWLALNATDSLQPPSSPTTVQSSTLSLSVTINPTHYGVIAMIERSPSHSN
jgi:hypothetical protein